MQELKCEIEIRWDAFEHLPKSMSREPLARCIRTLDTLFVGCYSVLKRCKHLYAKIFDEMDNKNPTFCYPFHQSREKV